VRASASVVGPAHCRRVNPLGVAPHGRAAGLGAECGGGRVRQVNKWQDGRVHFKTEVVSEV